MKRYQIKLINTETNESIRTTFSYSNRKEAEKWCEAWRNQGKPFDAEIIDTKKRAVK